MDELLRKYRALHDWLSGYVEYPAWPMKKDLICVPRRALVNKLVTLVELEARVSRVDATTTLLQGLKDWHDYMGGFDAPALLTDRKADNEVIDDPGKVCEVCECGATESDDTTHEDWCPLGRAGRVARSLDAATSVAVATEALRRAREIELHDPGLAAAIMKAALRSITLDGKRGSK